MMAAKDGRRVGCLFDLDGVLVHTRRANHAAYRQAIADTVGATAAERLSDEAFTAAWGRDWSAWLPQIAGERSAAVRARKAELYPSLLRRHGRVLPGTAALRRLAGAGIPVAITSNASARSVSIVRDWLAAVELGLPADLPSFTPDGTLAAKPAPDLLIAARRALRAADAVLVDDDPVLGGMAARAAGVDFILADDAPLCPRLDRWLARHDLTMPSPQGAARKAVGVLLAAGQGRRLAPEAMPFHKPLVRVGGRPVVAYGAAALAPLVHELLVVANPANAGPVVETVTAAAKSHGIPVRPVAQDSPRGVADALLCALNLLADDVPVVMVCADNVVDSGDVARVAAQAEAPASDPRLVWTYRSAAPEEARRLAVLQRDGEGREVLVEKPPVTEPSKCWCGPIALTSAHDARRRLSHLPTSARGELEITDLMNEYLRAGAADAVALRGAWFDVGTPQALAAARRHFAQAVR